MSETSAPRTARVDPDQIAELESERDFLLRSLDDLELERENGNIDSADYERLKDDYTARAAAVLRALRDGIDARPVAPPIPARRRWLIAGVLALFAVVVGALLAGALGSRVPGGSATGNSQAVDRVQDHIDKGFDKVKKNDLPGALREFGDAYKLNPRNPQAASYTGWIAFQLGQEGIIEANEATAKALRLLDEAIAVDSEFPDAHFFKGIVLLRGKNDRTSANAEFDKVLALVPSGPVADEARALKNDQPTTTTTRSP